MLRAIMTTRHKFGRSLLAILSLFLLPAVLYAGTQATTGSATKTYEYYSPVQPVSSIMLGSIYAEDIHGDMIRDNEEAIDEIKEVIKEIDPDIDIMELVQTSTPDTKQQLQFSLKKNEEDCNSKACLGEYVQELTFLRDPFMPVAVFDGNNIYTEINVLSNYSCFNGKCSSSTSQYKLKSVVGSNTVFNDYPSGNQNMGGNLLALPGRTFLSMYDGKSDTKGSAFMYSSKFTNYKKIVLDGDPLLGIGHVDEMIQIIPDPTSRCGVALIVASPALFMEKFGNYKLSYFKDTGEVSNKNPRFGKLQNFTFHISKLFDEKADAKTKAYAEYYKKLFNLTDKNSTYSGVESYLYTNMEKVTLKMLVAPYVDDLEEKINKSVDKIRNNYVCPSQDYINKVTIAGKEWLVKDSIRAAKTDAALSVYKLPVMWLNNTSIFSSKGFASSVLPNFINSVVIPKYTFDPAKKLKSVNVHIIVPGGYVFSYAPKIYTEKVISDQYASIQNFIVKKNSAAGLNIDYKITLHFIDSSFYGAGYGELHCATNEIRQFFYQ